MSEDERQALAIRLYDNWQVTNTSDSLEIYCYERGKKDGYNKSIDDIKEELMKNGFIYTQHALDVFNEIAEQLKKGGEQTDDN